MAHLTSVCAHIDDILIVTETFHEHVQLLKKCFPEFVKLVFEFFKNAVIYVGLCQIPLYHVPCDMDELNGGYLASGSESKPELLLRKY